MNYEIKNAYRETTITSDCDTRPMTDEERLRYGKVRPNSQELYWILKNPKKAAEYQNTYGLSDEYMTELKQCMAQKGYERGLKAKADSRLLSKNEILKKIVRVISGPSEEELQAGFEDAAVPMGLRGESIII
jgi:hypothetical protein